MTEFPDAETLLQALLKPLLPGVHVCLELPPGDALDARLPVVQLTRSGGTDAAEGWGSGPVFDRPTVDADVYGSSRESVNETAALLRAAIKMLPGQDMVLTAREITGPAWRPTGTPLHRVGLLFFALIRL